MPKVYRVVADTELASESILPWYTVCAFLNITCRIFFMIPLGGSCGFVRVCRNEGTREREVHQRLLSIRRGHAEESDDGWNIADRLIE